MQNAMTSGRSGDFRRYLVRVLMRLLQHNFTASSIRLLVAQQVIKTMGKTNAKKTTGSSAVKLEPIKFVGGSTFLKELQKTVFFAAYDSVVTSANSISEQKKNELLLKAVLGDGRPDNVSLSQQMVLGINQFAGLYDDVEAEVNDDPNSSSSGTNHNEFDKKLKDYFFPQKSNSGGKLAIYANKENGIIAEVLRAKALSNPVDISAVTIARGAKEALKNGKKALACAQDSQSEYRDGTLPSGKTLADYHKFIRQSMFVQLNGGRATSGDDRGDDDAEFVSEKDKDDGEENKEDDDDNDFMPVEADDMPEDNIFPGMIAFFLWGFIIDDSSGNEEKYRSKQYQLDDSSPDQKGSNGRRQVRKDAGSVVSGERDAGAAAGSPFKRGTTLTQQIEIAKLQAATGIEERKSLDQEFGTEMHNLQLEIENRIELAKLWQVTDRSDPLFEEIKELMDKKTELTRLFKGQQAKLNSKRQMSDEMLEEAFVPVSRRGRVTAASSTATTSPPMSLSILGEAASSSCLTGDNEDGRQDSPDNCRRGSG